MKTVIEMAREACDTDKVDAWHNDFWTLTQEELERFFHAAYAAGAAAEREACADLCYQLVDNSRETRFATAIRARGNT